MKNCCDKNVNCNKSSWQVLTVDSSTQWLKAWNAIFLLFLFPTINHCYFLYSLVSHISTHSHITDKLIMFGKLNAQTTIPYDTI